MAAPINLPVGSAKAQSSAARRWSRSERVMNGAWSGGKRKFRKTAIVLSENKSILLFCIPPSLLSYVLKKSKLRIRYKTAKNARSTRPDSWKYEFFRISHTRHIAPRRCLLSLFSGDVGRPGPFSPELTSASRQFCWKWEKKTVSRSKSSIFKHSNVFVPVLQLVAFIEFVH